MEPALTGPVTPQAIVAQRMSRGLRYRRVGRVAIHARARAIERPVEFVGGQKRRLPARQGEPPDERGCDEDRGKHDPLLALHAASGVRAAIIGRAPVYHARPS